MTEERNMCGAQTQPYHHQQMAKPTHHLCKQYKYFHVMIQLEDGQSVDGIIVDVGDNEITILVGEGVSGDQYNQRQFGYGFGRYPYRRFRPRIYPLATLASLALLPYVTPYPYYNPYPYPYPYYY